MRRFFLLPVIFGLVVFGWIHRLQAAERQLTNPEMAVAYGGSGLGPCCETNSNCQAIYYQNSCGDEARNEPSLCQFRSIYTETNRLHCIVQDPPITSNCRDNYDDEVFIYNWSCIWDDNENQCFIGTIVSSATNPNKSKQLFGQLLTWRHRGRRQLRKRELMLDCGVVVWRQCRGSRSHQDLRPPAAVASRTT